MFLNYFVCFTSKICTENRYNYFKRIKPFLFSRIVRTWFGHVGDKISIVPPFYIRGGKYIQLGTNFRALSGLRLEAIDFYNNERPHASINMMTPAEAQHCKGDIKRKWKNYYKKRNKESIVEE